MKRALIVGSAVVAGAAAMALLPRRRRTDLRGQTVVITGGSRGLGFALAQEFARRGCQLLLCARNSADLEQARSHLRGLGVPVMTRVCDVTDRRQVEELIHSANTAFGHIDILINNAGAIRVGPVQTMTLEDFRDAMDVMFWGTVQTALTALPGLRERGKGCIVNIASIGGKVAVPHLLPYSCAKFAALAFSEGLAAELQGSGVHVLTIAPGLMRTGSFVNALFKGAERGEAGWFSASSSLPGISMSARRAARQIVRAIEEQRSERILSTPANLLALFHGMFPELSVAVLGLVNQLLPSGSEREESGRESGLLQRPWMKALTVLGRKAGRELLQPV